MVQSLGRAAVPARLLRASREQAPTCRADRVTAPAFLRASVSPRAERVSQLLASGGFRARPSATFQAASLEGWLHTGPCWEGSCLQPCLWRDGGSRWAARPGRHPSSAAPGCSVPSLGLSFTFRAMGTPPPRPPVGQRPFTFFSPEGAAPGVEVSPGPELHLAATRGHRGAQAPRAGPTDSLGQVAAGWTGLFPTFLCNQVIQGQLACLHKGRRARPQLGRGRLLKGPAHPEAPPRGPSPSLPRVAHVDAAGATTTVADIVHCHVALPRASGRVEQGQALAWPPPHPRPGFWCSVLPSSPWAVSPSGHWGGRGVSAGRRRRSLRDLRQVASLSGPRFPWPHEAAAHAGSAFG